MTSLWARIEPLLARVVKSARHIGCEDGAATPRRARGKVSWLLAYFETDEIGLPNQGPQILNEILNERDDAVDDGMHAPSIGTAHDRLGLCTRLRAALPVGLRGHAIEDLSNASSADGALDEPRPRQCAASATTGTDGTRRHPVSRTRPGRYDRSGAAHTAMDRARQRAQGDHPRAPVRPAHSGGVRMRRDFRNGQQRHVGHDERHPAERG